MRLLVTILITAWTACSSTVAWAQSPLVFQSDFGTKDGAVSAMKGGAASVSADLRMYDVTHEIPAFNVWEAALRLDQAASYWPPGTVFVSVIDPGVGTERKSVVLKTTSGHYFVTPDNGTLTFVAVSLGIAAVREIDEAVNRLQNSERSYTFHGRDVYAYTGARLAANVITFDDVGGELPQKVVSIPYQQATFADATLRGNIPILDVQYGNVWTNIGRNTFDRLGVEPGTGVTVTIRHDQTIVFSGVVPFFPTFGSVEVGESLVYLNSLNNVSLAINQGDFAGTFGVRSGADWSIEIAK